MCVRQTNVSIPSIRENLINLIVMSLSTRDKNREVEKIYPHPLEFAKHKKGKPSRRNLLFWRHIWNQILPNVLTVGLENMKFCDVLDMCVTTNCQFAKQVLNFLSSYNFDVMLTELLTFNIRQNRIANNTNEMLFPQTPEGAGVNCETL